MRALKTVCRLVAVLAFALASALDAPSLAQDTEALARRQYESGLSFLKNGRHTEAVKDFQAVVDSFPQSSVADDALLQIALQHLDVTQDLAAAQAGADRLLKDYPGSDSAPMGYVLAGRLTIAKSQDPEAVDAALASFERVPRLFPGSPAVAAARYYAGDTLRLVRRLDDAVRQFSRASLDDPQSIWAARADLAMAASFVAADRAPHAFGRLQRIRQQFPGTREALTALHYNTIIYRLYLRKPSPYNFSDRYIGGEKDRFRDVVGVEVDAAGHILLGHKQGISIFDAKGLLVRQVAAAEPSAFFAEDQDRVVVVRREALIAEGGAPIRIMVPVAGKAPRPVEEIPSVVTVPGGDRLVADRKGKAVIRISPAGTFITNFASVNPERLATNFVGDVAIIDRDSKGIVIVDRNGQRLSRIPPKGPDYQWDQAADLSFDALGHLYVLDSKKAAIHVFSPKNRLIATIASPVRQPGSLQKPQAMALDAAGRLYVFDESSQRIQVYQ